MEGLDQVGEETDRVVVAVFQRQPGDSDLLIEPTSLRNPFAKKSGRAESGWCGDEGQPSSRADSPSNWSTRRGREMAEERGGATKSFVAGTGIAIGSS